MIQRLLYPHQPLGILLPRQQAGLTSLLPAGLSQAKAQWGSWGVWEGVCPPLGLSLVIVRGPSMDGFTTFTYTAIEVVGHIEKRVETRTRKMRIPIATQSPTWDSRAVIFTGCATSMF